MVIDHTRFVNKPMEMQEIIPEWLKGLLREVEENPKIKIKDYDLKQQDLDPVRVRRWFSQLIKMDMNHRVYFWKPSKIQPGFRQKKAGRSKSSRSHECQRPWVQCLPEQLKTVFVF
jgi:AraC family transcriptional regulator, regulatory protein of adaptative response / methylated-DNA-[protein]-cysteine methyltransferase